MDDTIEKPKIQERVWGIDARADSTVSYAEFSYWAKIERAEEMERERHLRALEGPWTVKKMMKKRFSKGFHHDNKKREEASRREQAAGASSSADEKAAIGHAGLTENVGTTDSGSTSGVSDEEWKTAARALRTATWGSVFYLITTDILGWSSCP